MEKYILSLDSGTTSNRAILFNRSGEIVATASREFEQICHRPGWVEHDPEVIWSTQLEAAQAVLSECRITAGQVEAIGIASQRETTVVWDRDTGRPLHHAIVWQDRRTAAFCDRLKEAGHEPLIMEKTGLVCDAYFSASKLRWVLDHVGEALPLARQGKLAFGTIDTWLVWKLTGGRLHITDVSNASRTMLFNIHTLEWDRELLDLFGIPRSVLPEVVPSSMSYGSTAPAIFGSPVPLAGIAGDQQAALFGQMCLREGMVKNTYGTGCFVVMNTGRKPIRSGNRLLSTIAWKIGDEVTYALEGSIFMGGAAVQWLRDEMGMISESSEIEELAGKVYDNGGVYFAHGFTGLGAPHWDQYATGAIIGLSRGTNRSHIARAVLEGIAFSTKEVIRTMEEDSGISMTELRVDGGASVNDLLMQIQSDSINKKVVRPVITETTALGAAFMAGLASGFWENTGSLMKQWKPGRIFVPGVDSGKTGFHFSRWQKAVERSRNWYSAKDIV